MLLIGTWLFIWFGCVVPPRWCSSGVLYPFFLYVVSSSDCFLSGQNLLVGSIHGSVGTKLFILAIDFELRKASDSFGSRWQFFK